jgi:peptidoglycan hydrolase-like protein with peptidoglycan-binding domain
MSTSEERQQIAQSILDFEAERDNQGHLRVYKLPAGDGGGTYEVAGINNRYHPEEALHLAELITAGLYAQAEAQAREFIGTYTDFVQRWTSSTAVESYLRDCAFNRGPRGAARILQRAVHVKDDGVVGALTLAAVRTEESDPAALLQALRQAREQYERDVAHRDESSKFWRGLVNRWDQALQFAERFLSQEPEATAWQRADERWSAQEPRSAEDSWSDEGFPTADDLSTDEDSSTAGASSRIDNAWATGGHFDAAQAAIAEAMGNRRRTSVGYSWTPSYDTAGHTRNRTPPNTGADLGWRKSTQPSGGTVLSPSPALVTLRALRIGSEGDLIRAWQSFLAGQGFDPGGLDGVFGDKTAAATREFQSQNSLTEDGIAGRQTILAAMQRGFELIEEPARDTSGSNFPPRPNFPPLENTAARQALFGRFDYVSDPRPGNPENIRILGTWERDNIIAVPIPQLRALGPRAPGSMPFHRLAANQLRGLWADWQRANLLDRVLSFDGSFSARFIRGSRTQLSNHCFGTAFDINAAENPLGARPPLVGERGSTRELVQLANKWGFYWGGHFGSRPDGMHFEVAVLRRDLDALS